MVQSIVFDETLPHLEIVQVNNYNSEKKIVGKRDVTVLRRPVVMDEKYTVMVRCFIATSDGSIPDSTHILLYSKMTNEGPSYWQTPEPQLVPLNDAVATFEGEIKGANRYMDNIVYCLSEIMVVGAAEAQQILEGVLAEETFLNEKR